MVLGKFHIEKNDVQLTLVNASPLKTYPRLIKTNFHHYFMFEINVKDVI